MATIMKQLWDERKISILMYFLLFPIISFSFADASDKYLFIPPIACPDYFQYAMRRDGHFIGKLTLRDVKIGRTAVEVQFSQQVPLDTDYFGTISLIQDDEKIGFNQDNDTKLTFRIDFPMEKVVPKLTKIIVNNEVICSTSGYKAPSTSFKMQRTIRVAALPVDKSTSFEFTPEVKSTVAEENQLQILSFTQELNLTKDWLLEGICGHGELEQGQGSILRRGQYPWLAAIYKKELAGSAFISGGSLISTRTIVTAAHYFMRKNLTADDISVSLGRHNLSDFSESGYIELDVNTLVIHPEYKSGYLHSDADIALLLLLEPVAFTQFIRPICLWKTDTDESIVGKPAVVAGWNVMDDYETAVVLPKKAHANVVSQDTCLLSSPVYYALTSSRTLCAGKRDGTGPCGGGDGLMVNRCGRWTLRAIASAGQARDNKCDLDQYVVYCDIAKHMSWIQSHMLI